MACVTQSHPFILRNSLIFILRHIMAQKSDEVRRCSAVQGRMQCSARADAVHCKGGRSALRERLQCTASEMGKNWYRNLNPSAGYLHRNNTGLARVHYIYVQLSEESSPQKKLLRTSSVPYTEKVRRGEGEATDLGRKCQRPTAATSSSGPSNCCSPVCIFLSITLP